MSQRILGKTVELATRQFDPYDLESDDDEQIGVTTSIHTNEKVMRFDMKYSELVGNYRHSSSSVLTTIIRINSHYRKSETSNLNR